MPHFIIPTLFKTLHQHLSKINFSSIYNFPNLTHTHFQLFSQLPKCHNPTLRSDASNARFAFEPNWTKPFRRHHIRLTHQEKKEPQKSRVFSPRRKCEMNTQTRAFLHFFVSKRLSFFLVDFCVACVRWERFVCARIDFFCIDSG